MWGGGLQDVVPSRSLRNIPLFQTFNTNLFFMSCRCTKDSTKCSMCSISTQTPQRVCVALSLRSTSTSTWSQVSWLSGFWFDSLHVSFNAILCLYVDGWIFTKGIYSVFCLLFVWVNLLATGSRPYYSAVEAVVPLSILTNLYDNKKQLKLIVEVRQIGCSVKDSVM